ncbi:hypothetical protein LSTR_LSTR011268 [Laodelphax striatellus]|uniref:Uncharacterized protein n=1 Tax=Laodelphax striatellus TaxID=195883 RepID=A0A482WTI4_LAOST|nr:hypothetical protein LSTR_LSTR011268 [Laodelphax striatellus]
MRTSAVFILLLVASVTTLNAKTIFECTPESKIVQKLPFFLCSEVKNARLFRTEENLSHEKVRIFVQSLDKPSKADEEALKKQKKTLKRKKRVARRHHG